MAKMKHPADHEVGYGKPPKQTRFRPGQSGNPKGRPKGHRNLKTDLMEELGERIVVREGDRTRTVSKQRAVVITLVNRTLKGDARAANTLIGATMRLIDQAEGSSEAIAPLEHEDLEIMKAFEKRARRGAADSAVPGDKDSESAQ